MTKCTKTERASNLPQRNAPFSPLQKDELISQAWDEYLKVTFPESLDEHGDVTEVGPEDETEIEVTIRSMRLLLAWAAMKPGSIEARENHKRLDAAVRVALDVAAATSSTDEVTFQFCYFRNSEECMAASLTVSEAAAAATMTVTALGVDYDVNLFRIHFERFLEIRRKVGPLPGIELSLTAVFHGYATGRRRFFVCDPEHAGAFRGTGDLRDVARFRAEV